MKRILTLCLLTIALAACNKEINGVKLQDNNISVSGSNLLTYDEAIKHNIPSIYQWLRFFEVECKDGDVEFLENFNGLHTPHLNALGWEFKNIGTPDAALVNKEKSISLPLAGWRKLSNGLVELQGTHGFYWSSTESSSSDAWDLGFGDENGLYISASSKSYGSSVRSLK